MKIGNIEFEEIGDTLISSDGSISIYGTSGEEQSLALTDVEMEACVGFFEQYCITSIAISRLGLEGEIDLNAIQFPERVKKLQLQLLAPTEIILPESTDFFQNLRELNISGTVPEKFINLKLLTNLSALSLEYGNGLNADWLDLTYIRDLNIHNFKESDLAVLKDLKNLKRLRLTDGKMKSLNGVELLSQLETLFVAANASKLVNVNAIIRSKSLKNIMFENLKKIQKWDFLKEKSDLECISLDTAESVELIKALPRLEFLFCKKVVDRKNKGFLFSTTLHQDTMTKDGIQVSYIVPCNRFYDPLD